MKDSLVEDVIRISKELVKAGDLLCDKHKSDCCSVCPLFYMSSCADSYSLACLEYNNETGKYE